MMKKVVIWY